MMNAHRSVIGELAGPERVARLLELEWKADVQFRSKDCALKGTVGVRRKSVFQNAFLKLDWKFVYVCSDGILVLINAIEHPSYASLGGWPRAREEVFGRRTRHERLAVAVVNLGEALYLLKGRDNVVYLGERGL